MKTLLYVIASPILLVGCCSWVILSLPLCAASAIATALGDEDTANKIFNLTIFPRFE